MWQSANGRCSSRSGLSPKNCLLRLLLLTLTAPPGSQVSGYDPGEFSRNISRTLNGILSDNYDKTIRPDIGGVPVKVMVNLHVKSLGPVSENDEMYFLDVYFRQSWYDGRLGFSVPGIEEFSMSWLFMERIWKPDTYFVNGKKSHLHRMTSPNKFVRIRKDGQIVYSMRLTISASCKMYLRKFPLDSQICPLIIGSYGYTQNDVTYEWDSDGVKMEPGISEAQYDIVNTSTFNDQISLRGTDQYSVVSAKFYFRRSIGYYVLQVYVPCILIVCCSWISFWITPSDVSGRTTLAVTTVLAITTMGLGGRSQMPKVSHATALDWFVIICFAFAFAVMIEYAAINFTEKLAADIKKLLEKKKAADEKEAEDKAKEKERRDEQQEKSFDSDLELLHIDIEFPEGETERRGYIFRPHRWLSIPADLSKEALRDELPWPAGSTPTTSTTRGGRSPLGRYQKTLMAPVRFFRGLHFIPSSLDPKTEEKFHQIDMVARRVFPLTFTCIVLTYSALYTYYIPDGIAEDTLIQY